jgi:hypothetical protein
MLKKLAVAMSFKKVISDWRFPLVSIYLPILFELGTPAAGCGRSIAPYLRW